LLHEQKEKPANAAGFPVIAALKGYFTFEQSEPGHST
jgi:hypothetical protein